MKIELTIRGSKLQYVTQKSRLNFTLFRIDEVVLHLHVSYFNNHC